MTWDFEQLRRQARDEILKTLAPKELEDCRIKYLGRKGLVQEIYAGLARLSKEDKPRVGKGANDLKNFITALLDEQSSKLKRGRNEKKPTLDVTLPGVYPPLGRQHILTQIVEEVCGIFKGLGFVVKEGPEVETEFNNFTALNIPVDHPSRDAFDTFYLRQADSKRKDRNLLLRSQTSPVQIRVMRNNKPPLAVVAPGKVYRPDAVDATHSFMFHQIEGLLVDKGVTFAELKGLLTEFCHRFFGKDVKMRFRPHFFPFTEPSAEVDISWDSSKKSSKKWLEIMGCGLVHPKVFESCGYKKGEYTGLAFGMGVERMAMLRYGINDIRLFYENDQRFLNQF